MADIRLGNNNTTFKVGSTDVDAIYLGTTLVYQSHNYESQYLTFVAQESGTFKFSGNSINYSLDSGSTWTTLANNTNSPTVQSGDSIMWKAEITPGTNGSGRFSSTGQFVAEGNAMSLLYGDNFSGQTSLSGKNNAFVYLFSGCTSLTSAENLILPATTLANICYYGMFQGCTSLTTAPQLPATTIAERCYNYMFRDCTSLTTAPSILPASNLSPFCYYGMFQGCTSLTSSPVLPAFGVSQNRNYTNMFSGCTSLSAITCLAEYVDSSCTGNWVSGVASSGTFTKARNMSGWTTGVNGIPSGWTVVDYPPQQ